MHISEICALYLQNILLIWFESIKTVKKIILKTPKIKIAGLVTNFKMRMLLLLFRNHVSKCIYIEFDQLIFR